MTSLLALAQAAHDTPAAALDLLVILATASGVALVLQRLKMTPIPGYLLAGALVGPHALEFVGDVESVARISSLAIVLLMFTIGLQLETHALRDAMVPIAGVGVASTVLSTLLLWPTGMAFGLHAPGGLVVALAMAMSSTAVVLQILQSRRELRRLHARLCMGVAIAQDLLAVAALALLPPIAAWAGAPVTGAVGEVGLAPGRLEGWRDLVLSAMVGLGGIGCLIAGGRVLLPWLIQRIGSYASPEVVLVVSASVALGAAFATASLGFSPEMGAFLAGFLLAGTPFKHQLVGQLAPLRDLLMAVFFTSVGLQVDPAAAARSWWIIAAGAGALVALKAISIAGSAWAIGAGPRTAALAGAYLAQAGEFSLVILAAAGEKGILRGGEPGVAILIIVVSLIATPGVMALGRRLGGRVEHLPPAPWIVGSALLDPTGDAGAGESSTGTQGAPARRAIVAGFGPVGRALADSLARSGVRCTIVDLNPRTIVTQRALGRDVIFGDITNREVLEAAGVLDAHAVVLTIPDEEAVVRACQTIRSMAPGVFIAARTNVLSRALAAKGAGADHVTVEEIATAQAMESQVMAALRAREQPLTP